MKLTIVLPSHFELWTAPAWFAPRLQQEFPRLEVVQRDRYQDAVPDLRDAEIAVAFALRPEHFRGARKLRWIHSPAAAVHQLLIPEIVASDVTVTNGRGVHGAVVATPWPSYWLWPSACPPPCATRHGGPGPWIRCGASSPAPARSPGLPWD